jgi:hypothetical protein
MELDRKDANNGRKEGRDRTSHAKGKKWRREAIVHIVCCGRGLFFTGGGVVRIR